MLEGFVFYLGLLMSLIFLVGKLTRLISLTWGQVVAPVLVGIIYLVICVIIRDWARRR